MNDILLYISLGLAILWSIRMAQSKRRNPFVWAGLTFALMLIPTFVLPSLPPILGIAPLLILVFLKPSTSGGNSTSPEQITCPKCKASHMSGYRYCVNCGWELVKSYPNPATPDPIESVSEPIMNRSKPASYESPQEPILDSAIGQSDPDNYDTVENGLKITPNENASTGEGRPEEKELPVPKRPTTAVGLTDWGVQLSVEGRHREAIDQFTKALALDSQYVLAWEKRAESYKAMGMNEKSSQDLDHLKGLTSS